LGRYAGCPIGSGNQRRKDRASPGLKKNAASHHRNENNLDQGLPDNPTPADIMEFNMNPYASHLAGGNPFEVIRATAGQLGKFVQTLGPDQLDRAPAPGKWSVRDILCHLADCEVVFAFRLRQALAEDHHVIQPFDQDKWASVYRHYEARAALAAFTSVREWNRAFISGLTPQAFEKPLNHPERGDMTLQVVVETMAGHDLNHLRQVEAIAASRAA
jgi:uncharacterized damage-inducible protein DinB